MACLGPRHFHRQGISELVLEAPRACCNRSKFGWPAAAQIPPAKGMGFRMGMGRAKSTSQGEFGGLLFCSRSSTSD